MAFVKMKDEYKRYQMGDSVITANDGINFEIEKGEFAVILGPSGAGKSTVLNILGGMDSADEGQVFVDNVDIATFTKKQLTTYRRNEIGFVFQFYNLVPNLTTKENVELASQISPRAMDATEVLQQVGLGERLNNFPAQLSGGEQQRVAIARVLMQNPKIILADEPTASLDPQTSVRVMNDLKMLNEKYGMTVVANLHSIELAQQFGERVIGIRAGQVVYDGKMKDTPKSVFTDIYNGGDGSEEAE